MSRHHRFVCSLRPLAPISFTSKSPVRHQKRDVHYAHHLFDETPYKDLCTLNSRLATYARENDALSAWALFTRMHRACYNLDSYTFTPVLGACSALAGGEICGRKVHALMIETGSESETVTKTALMDMYSKHSQLGDSIRVFEEIIFKDVVVWNALVSSFLRHGRPMEALNAFEAMRRERVVLSEFTLCSVLKACGSLKAFQQGKQVHGLVIVMGRDLVILGTALIDFYSNIGYVEEAMKVYRNLGDRNDYVMRNSLISGCVQNRKYKEAFAIMSTMRPNIVALTSALSACSKNSDVLIGKQIHGVAIRLGFSSDTQLCNVLLDMYAKCGRIVNARSLFDRMFEKDVVSWTSMIDAYGSHGHGLEALELFKKMGEERSGALPNSVTFLAVLSACGHSGMVEEGRECFLLVQEKYGLSPGPEHYACFIDMIGRAGLMEDVWGLLDDMVKNGTKPTAAVWAAVSNACRHNLDVMGGEFAARQLLELDPSNPGNYVQLSNLYAAIGRWDSVDELRSIMKEKGLEKELGSSCMSVVQAG